MSSADDIARADALSRELARELPEPSRADFLRLTRALLHGPRFQWLLAETPSDALRDRLLAQIDRVVLTAHLQSSRLPLDESLSDVPALEAALVCHAKGCAVVHVLGRRGWFDAARWDAFNVRRERLAQEARACLVFWLDAESIEAASMGAPDLWAWRSGVYSFSEDGDSVLIPLNPILPSQVGDSVSPDLYTLAQRRARVADIRAWLAANPSADDEMSLMLMDELGRLLFSVGEYDQALTHWLHRQLPLCEQLGHEHSTAVTRGHIADVLQLRGDMDAALRIRQQEELPIYERLGDLRSVAATRGQIADVLAARGQLDDALQMRIEQQLPLYEQLGDARAAMITRVKIADILQARGELDHVLPMRQEQLAYFDGQGDMREAAAIRGKIADILQARGQFLEALRIRLEEELPVYERLGEIREVAIAKGKIADILHARGEIDEALRIRQEEQLPVYERLGDVRGLAVTRWKIGLQLLVQGEPENGERLLRQAWGALQAMKLPEADQLAAQMHARGLSTGGEAAAS